MELKDITLNESDTTVKPQYNEMIVRLNAMRALLVKARPFINNDIPSTFTINMAEYKVISNDDNPLNNCAHIDYTKGEVHIMNTINNTDQCTNLKEISFYHELAHALLYNIGEHKLNDNEKFVEALGRGIYSFLKTRTYDTQSNDSK